MLNYPFHCGVHYTDLPHSLPQVPLIWALFFEVNTLHERFFFVKKQCMVWEPKNNHAFHTVTIMRPSYTHCKLI